MGLGVNLCKNKVMKKIVFLSVGLLSSVQVFSQSQTIQYYDANGKKVGSAKVENKSSGADYKGGFEYEPDWNSAKEALMRADNNAKKVDMYKEIFDDAVRGKLLNGKDYNYLAGLYKTVVLSIIDPKIMSNSVSVDNVIQTIKGMIKYVNATPECKGANCYTFPIFKFK